MEKKPYMYVLVSLRLRLFKQYDLTGTSAQEIPVMEIMVCLESQKKLDEEQCVRRISCKN